MPALWIVLLRTLKNPYRAQGYITLAREVFSGAGAGGAGGLTGAGLGCDGTNGGIGGGLRRCVALDRNLMHRRRAGSIAVSIAVIARRPRRADFRADLREIRLHLGLVLAIAVPSVVAGRGLAFAAAPCVNAAATRRRIARRSAQCFIVSARYPSATAVRRLDRDRHANQDQAARHDADECFFEHEKPRNVNS